MVLLLAFACGTRQKVKNNVVSDILVKKPLMGWNSWNSMGFEISEHHIKGIADYMAENLLEYGYEYVVIDAGWYYPEHFTTNMGHTKNPEQSIDQYGRLIPDTMKFPSASGGSGFKPTMPRNI